MRSAVVALGGNAIIPANGRGTIEEQYRVTEQAMREVATLVLTGARILLTHGNGPIVGNIMLRNEAAKNLVPPMPLYICDADSQGGIGLMLQQVLANELVKRGRPTPVATVVTQTVVDADDPAFRSPTKPIGPFYTRDEAARIAKERDWVVRDDAKRGYRRLVPSPTPREIVEVPVIRALVDAGVVVIAVGGGGVPVIRDAQGSLRGVDAVVDKDLASSTIAQALGFENLIFLTGTARVFIRYGTPEAVPLGRVTCPEMRRHHAEGHFPPGSMGPKIDAALAFLDGGGKEVLITSPEALTAALDGRSGTTIVSDPGAR
jgi:carbamate kinase